MEELIDIVDNKGLPTGKVAPKSEIHLHGHLHNTAHVWCYNAEGEILLQQRSASKTIFPLLWDVSVAGHVDAGETVEAAAIREAQEEIGLLLSTSQLHKIGVFECFQSYANEIKDNELHNTYIVEINVDIKDLKPQQDEVEALKFVSIETFEQLLDNSTSNMHFVPSNKGYYLNVLEAIKNKL